MTTNKELLRKEIGSFLKKARKNQSLTGHQLGRLVSNKFRAMNEANPALI